MIELKDLERNKREIFFELLFQGVKYIPEKALKGESTISSDGGPRFEFNEAQLRQTIILLETLLYAGLATFSESIIYF